MVFATKFFRKTYVAGGVNQIRKTRGTELSLELNSNDMKEFHIQSIVLSLSPFLSGFLPRENGDMI